MVTPVVASRNPLWVCRQQNSQAPGHRFVTAPCTSQGLGVFTRHMNPSVPQTLYRKRTLEKRGLVVRVFIGSVGVICPGVCFG